MARGKGFENPFVETPAAETPGEKAFRDREALAREGVSGRASDSQRQAGERAIRRRGSHEGAPDESGGEVDLTEGLPGGATEEAEKGDEE